MASRMNCWIRGGCVENSARASGSTVAFGARSRLAVDSLPGFPLLLSLPAGLAGSLFSAGELASPAESGFVGSGKSKGGVPPGFLPDVSPSGSAVLVGFVFFFVVLVVDFFLESAEL